MSFETKKFKNTYFKDHRGYYWTSWKKGNPTKIKFNHDKFSLSKKNVLRGLHGDSKTWKLLSCVYGELFLAVVNCNKRSKSYLKSKTWTLSQKNRIQILIPPNYANGYLCLSKNCLLHYKLYYKGKYFDVKNQFSIKWNDPRIKIKWPIKKPILSKRDK
tara:strand:- start:1235 stop:1711 length:477 start_codon:yes stop_codon:yes gene_type:complete